MSAETQTSSSTEAGSEPPAVVGQVNAGKKTEVTIKQNNAYINLPGRGVAEVVVTKKNNNNNNANSTTAEKGNNNNNNAKNGKNPVFEKISESISALEGSLEGSNCTSIQTKAKKVIENADPVIEAIEKQELRENNSQLSEVKGKVRNVTNSIRKKCPKGATANADPGTNAPPPVPQPPNAKCKTLLESKGITDRSSFRKWSLTAHPNKGGDEEEFKEMSSCADEVLQQAGGRRKRKTRKTRKHKRHVSKKSRKTKSRK